MAIDPQLLAILTGTGNLQSGNPNMLPRFQGGQGLDQNLLALLMSQGLLPKRIAGDGSYILPSAPQPTYGFHSPSQLDAFKAEGDMASRSPYAHALTSAPRASTPEEEAMLQTEMERQKQMLAQQQLLPTPQEISSMSQLRSAAAARLPSMPKIKPKTFRPY